MPTPNKAVGKLARDQRGVVYPTSKNNVQTFNSYNRKII